MELTQNSSVSPSEYRSLPLSQLQESPTNPRRRYNETALRELADSFRAQGILVPLLVRPVEPEHYEVVAGSRRFRAAQMAELNAVPVRVAEMTDAQALEAQCIENLHREDVHPLEEANAFAAMLQQGHDTTALAARIGKPATFVANRVQLIQLIPPIAEAFLEDKLSVGHATLIAKLPAAQQPDAFTAAFRSVWTTGGQTSILVPIKELAAWIESNILLDLRTAPFDRGDAALIPDAGSCHDCPRRTGFNTLLFSEFQQDNCLSRECFQAKIERHIARSLEQKPELIQVSTSWNGARNGGPLGRGHYTEIESAKRSKSGKKPVTPAHKKCSHAASGIVVDGGNRGHILTICADPACTVHHAEDQKARAAQEKTRTEQREQAEKRKLELTVRWRVLAGILGKIAAPLPKADLQLVTAAFFRNLPHEYQTALCNHEGAKLKNGHPGSGDLSAAFDTVLKGRDEAGLSRLLIEMALFDPASTTHADRAGALETAAKRYRVNAEKIRATVSADFAAKRKKRSESGRRIKTAAASKRAAR